MIMEKGSGQSKTRVLYPLSRTAPCLGLDYTVQMVRSHAQFLRIAGHSAERT